MRIGIDISQTVFEGTGVAAYVRNMVRSLVAVDKENTYILFGASLRRRDSFKAFFQTIHAINPHTELIVVPIPPTALDILWNRLHKTPVETFTGPLDIFWSSDWTQPPLAHAVGMTTIHDLIALKFPNETHAMSEITLGNISPNIVAIQKRRLHWVQKECSVVLCDSESTKKDVTELLGIPAGRLHVVCPGFRGVTA